MGNRIKGINLFLGLLLLAGSAGAVYEGSQWWRAEQANRQIRQSELVGSDAYPLQKKFMAAYKLGQSGDHKHAVQSYSQLLETAPAQSDQALIQYNIGNNLLLSGLKRRLNDDGSLKDEAKYDLSQARIAYEQALRLDPAARMAKFNLSLLLLVLPDGIQGLQKEQAGMELSNIPVGLP
ncbi:hypothetical protein LG200_02185 [Methylobacillus caricis]|uniref:hypothetical protein n=1 Tax=Methylobacillus caricis TaxID=1971611 RepID=UPI001CFF9B47|nr:hypothetical protein [Methylobacillus caricis]MCB5186809.1 hypothetical protein [Methylobacillus caricis]